jgi:hypothetical protein
VSIAGWQNSVDTLPNDCNDICKIVMLDNCAISHCFTTTDCVAAAYSVAYAEYENIVKAYCKARDAGGMTISNDWYMTVYNDPNWTPSSLEAVASSSKSAAGGIAEFELSIEAFNDFFNLTAEETPSKPSPEKRRSVRPRQQDGDTFHHLYSELSVINPSVRFQASGILSSGVTQTWSFTEEHSSTVSVSTEVGADLFSIFTASVSISVDQTYSESIQKGQSFTVGNCPNEAVVYYYPLFDHYGGWWSSNPDQEWSAWIPVAINGFAGGRFVTECLG